MMSGAFIKRTELLSDTSCKVKFAKLFHFLIFLNLVKVFFVKLFSIGIGTFREVS